METKNNSDMKNNVFRQGKLSDELTYRYLFIHFLFILYLSIRLIQTIN